MMSRESLDERLTNDHRLTTNAKTNNCQIKRMASAHRLTVREAL